MPYIPVVNGKKRKFCLQLFLYLKRVVKMPLHHENDEQTYLMGFSEWFYVSADYIIIKQIVSISNTAKVWRLYKQTRASKGCMIR